MILIREPRERSRFIRFAFVGVIGAIVDFGVMNLLVNVFNVPFLIAGTTSFVCAIISNFTWNRFWTYPDSRSKRIHNQMLQFAIISVVGLAIRTPLLALLEPPMIRLVEATMSNLGAFSINPEFVAHNITLAIAVLIVMFWNFFANRYWTYSDVDG
ncbi:MAG: GtrA family protein [Anaerolineales bacterium]|jgi:putative flippase GtrA